MSPDGLQFALPAQATWTVKRNELAADIAADEYPALFLLSRGSDGKVEILDKAITKVDLSGGMMIAAAELNHFSEITAADGALRAKLTPTTIDDSEGESVDGEVSVVLRRPPDAPADHSFGKLTVERSFAENKIWETAETSTVTDKTFDTELVITDLTVTCLEPGEDEFGVDLSISWEHETMVSFSTILFSDAPSFSRHTNIELRGSGICRSNATEPFPPCELGGVAIDNLTEIFGVDLCDGMRDSVETGNVTNPEEGTQVGGGDHTEIAAYGATIITVSEAAATTAASELPCGTSSLGYHACPQGSEPLAAGKYRVLSAIHHGLVPIADIAPGVYYQYSFSFDADDDPKNNTATSSFNQFGGIDRTYSLNYSGMPIIWSLGVTEHLEDPFPNTTCSHNPCAPGADLEAGCDSCVAKVCSKKSICCKSFWDSTCKDLVKSECGITCGPVYPTPTWHAVVSSNAVVAMLPYEDDPTVAHPSHRVSNQCTNSKKDTWSGDSEPSGQLDNNPWGGD